MNKYYVRMYRTVRSTFFSSIMERSTAGYIVVYACCPKHATELAQECSKGLLAGSATTEEPSK